MSDQLTVEDLTVGQMMASLRKTLPRDTFAAASVHLRGDMNRPENILKTVNSAEVYVEGGYWFRGPTLRDCLTQIREWKESQSKESK